MVYNRPDTVFFKAASRLQASADPLLEDAARVIAESRVDPETGVLVDSLPLDYFLKLESAPPRSTVERRRSSEDRLKGKAVEHAGTSDSHDDSEGSSEGSETEMSGHSILSFLDFGQKVNAKWTNGQYYAATVCQVNGDSNTVEVVFDDGVRLVRASCPSSFLSLLFRGVQGAFYSFFFCLFYYYYYLLGCERR